MDLLGLLDGSDLAGTDSPNGLVCDDQQAYRAIPSRLTSDDDVPARRISLASLRRIRNPNSLPVLLFDRISDRLELPLDHLIRDSLLPLLEALPDTSNHLELLLEGRLCLVRNHGIAIAKHGSALRVSEDDPVDVGVLELGGRDLAGECSRVFSVAVLGRDLHGGVEVLLDAKEVERRRGNDNLCRIVNPRALS
jgi:hypothetical protein